MEDPFWLVKKILNSRGIDILKEIGESKQSIAMIHDFHLLQYILMDKFSTNTKV